MRNGRLNRIRGWHRLLSAALWLAGSSSADPYRYRLHREPLLFVTGMAEAQDGSLWIAAHSGLFRYDGFHFERFTQLPMVLAQDVDLTADGTLWVSTAKGLVRYRGKFEVLTQEETGQMAAIGNMIAFRSRGGTWMMDTTGRRERVAGCGEDLFYASILVNAKRQFQLNCGADHELGRIAPSWTAQIRISPPAGRWVRNMTDAQGNTWLESVKNQLFLLPPGARESRPFQGPPYLDLHQYRLISDTGDSAWYLGNPTLNLTRGYELDRRRIVHRVTQLASGTRRNIWTAETGLGLVEYKITPGWQRWTSNQIGAESIQVARIGDRLQLYSDRGFLRLQNGKLSLQSTDGSAIRHVGDLGHGNSLVIRPESGMKVVNSAGGLIWDIPRPDRDLPRLDWAKGYQQSAMDGQGRIWISGHALMELVGPPGKGELRLVELPDQHDELSARDIQIDPAGRPWVGYSEGLAYLDGQRWVALPTDRPVRDIRSLELKGDEIWVAHRAPGAFKRLRRQGQRWTVDEFNIDDDNKPSRTQFIRVDSRGWIWRGVLGGVRVSNGKNLNDWLYLRDANGLDVGTPGFYGFAEDKDGSIWITGDKGVAHFQPDPGWFDAPRNAPPPLISKLIAKGRRIDAWVGGLHMPEFRAAPLEYRLLPLFDDWRGTSDGTLEFPDLRDNDYQLQVRYAGLGISPVTTRGIIVGRGAVHFPWAGTGGGLGSLALGWLLVRNTKPYRRVAYQVEKRLFLLRARTNTPGADESNALSAGDRVGTRFEIVRPVAHGGFSVIYEASDVQTGQRVAVKVMSRGTDASWARNRFSHEQNALRTIDHPHVVKILDAGVAAGGLLYLAMPFLEGPTLRETLQTGPLSPAGTLALLRSLADALEAAHRKGIVHLDFKPENIILTPQGAQLIDFGTSGLRGAEDEMAVTRMLSGSAFYMAPERLTGHYSAASDVYAFGLVAQEMLTGKKLSDYRAASFESEFETEFAAALVPAAGAKADLLAKKLMLALESEPRKRPILLGQWIDEWAMLLKST